MTRMTQTLDDTSSTGKKLKEIYADLGIALTDSQGNLRSTYDILYDLSLQWDNLSENQQQYIALTSSGSNQVQNYTALMNNFSKAVEATGVAEQSAGSAMRENSRYMESISAKITRLRSEIERLVLQDGVLSKLLKTLLDIGIALLKFANSDIGQAIIKILLFSTIITGAVNVLNKFTQAGNAVGNMLLLMITKLGKAESAMTAMEAKMAMTNLKITALVTVIYLAIKAFDLLTVSQREATQSLEEANSKIDDYEKQIEDLSSKINALNALRTDDSQSDEELKKLELETAEYEKQLSLVQTRIEEERNNAKESADDLWGARLRNPFSGEESGVSYNYKNEQVTEEILPIFGTTHGRFEQQLEGLDNLIAKQDELVAKRRELALSNQQESEEYKKLGEELNEVSDAVDKQKTNMLDGADAMNTISKSTSEYSDKAKKLFDSYTDLLTSSEKLKYEESEEAKALKSTEDVYAKLQEKIGMTSERVEEELSANEEALTAFYEALANGEYAQAYAIAMSNCAEANKDFTEEIEGTLSELERIENAYASLQGVVDEFNSGTVSLDSLDSLLTEYPEYIQYLELEGDQLSINREGLDAIAEARLNDAKMIAYQGLEAELTAIKNADMNDELYESTPASQSFVSATQSEINGLNTLLGWLAKGTQAWNNYHASETNSYNWRHKENKEAYEDAYKKFEKEIKIIDKAGGATGSFTKAVDANTKAKGSNTKATKENTDANEELVKSLEAQIKEYERVIKYINKKFDQEIDRIKDLKDAELDSIDARIDALEELRDAQLDAIQDQIDALEKENDALSDQLELQELLNNLAKAKSSKVKIYRGGQFVYDQDFEQVNEAQKALNEYNSKKRLQDQIDALNDYKDQVKKNYDQQIKDLENYRKAREKAWDAQIKYWEDYKQKFNDMVNSYENEQDRLKALELTGIDFEQQGWQTRLGNLTNFVNNYISLLNQLTEAKKKAQAEEYANSASVPSGGGGGGSSSGAKSTVTPTKLKASVNKNKKNVAGIAVSGVGRHSTIARAYASGSNYIKADELAVVGEDPHKEIVIGSDLNSNNGVMMNLHKGSGVVPATATSALMSLADNIRANGVNATANDIMSGGDVTNMEIANVNVTANNADEFVQSMREFRMSMVQKAYR